MRKAVNLGPHPLKVECITIGIYNLIPQEGVL